MEIKKVTYVEKCPKTGKPTDMWECETCNYFKEEFAEYIVCTYPEEAH